MSNKVRCLKYCYVVLSLLIILSALFTFASCKEEEKLYQDVTLEVFNSDTDAKIEENKTYRFEYDGNPKAFTAKVKLDETGKYLEDKDFENKDWKSHVKMYVMTENDEAYLDWKVVDGKNVVYDWTNAEHWPKESGVYDIQLDFNNRWRENSDKFIKTWFNFTIEII